MPTIAVTSSQVYALLRGIGKSRVGTLAERNQLLQPLQALPHDGWNSENTASHIFTIPQGDVFKAILIDALPRAYACNGDPFSYSNSLNRRACLSLALTLEHIYNLPSGTIPLCD